MSLLLEENKYTYNVIVFFLHGEFSRVDSRHWRPLLFFIIYLVRVHKSVSAFFIPKGILFHTERLIKQVYNEQN